MKNGRNVLIACGVLLIAALLILIYWPRKSKPVNSSQEISSSQPTPFPALATASKAPAISGGIPTQAEVAARKEIEIRALYRTPIAIFGKVVDEAGSPVPGATVKIGIADKPLETGSQFKQTTGSDGTFSLTGVHGIAFSLRASKGGYHTTDESRGRRNVVTPAVSDVATPSQSQPVVLVLRKQGQTAELIMLRSSQIIVPKTGQTVSIDLATGRLGDGDLHLSSWVGDTSQRRFDWRLRLSIPGGGLIERKDEFDFEAPTEGYEEVVEINMPGSAQEWSSDVTKEYFVRFDDGRYARCAVNFYPGRRNFVVIESFINPSSGSRNLESSSDQP